MRAGEYRMGQMKVSIVILLAGAVLGRSNIGARSPERLGRRRASFSDCDLDPLPTLRSGSIDRLDDHHVTTAQGVVVESCLFEAKSYNLVSKNQ